MKHLRDYKRVTKPILKKMLAEFLLGERSFELVNHYKYNDFLSWNYSEDYMPESLTRQILSDLEIFSFIKLRVYGDTLTIRYHSNEWIEIKENVKEVS